MYKTLRLLKIFLLILYYYLFEKKNKLNSLHKKIFKILNTKINVTGKLQKKGPYIIITNHYNLLELLVLSQLNLNFKTITKDDLLSKEIPFKIKNKFVEDHIYEKTKLITYKRGDRLDGMFVKIKILIENKIKNRNILIFPEGTSHKDGIPKSFKNGIFKLCSTNNLEILPIKIKFHEDIGIERDEGILNPYNLFNTTADVHIFPLQKNNNWEVLKNNVFNLLI